MDNPWEKEGVSRATYFRNKSHVEVSKSQEKVSNETKVSPPVSRLVFDGTNGNLVQDITRAEMQAVLDKNPKAFIPNWFQGGFQSRTLAVTNK